MWTRGLNCKTLAGLPHAADNDEYQAQWPTEAWPPGEYFSDGSGGPFSSIPRLRVAAGAVLAYDQDAVFRVPGKLTTNVTHYLEASIPGEQTINRAELHMVNCCLQAIDPVPGQWTTIVSDSDYVVKGYSDRGFARCCLGWNSELWDTFYSEVCRHGYRVILRKVYSHLGIFGAICSRITFRHLHGNGLADTAAKALAVELAPPQTLLSGIRASRSFTKRILQRLVAANIACLEMLKQKKQEDKKNGNYKEPVRTVSCSKTAVVAAAFFGASQCCRQLGVQKLWSQQVGQSVGPLELPVSASQPSY